MKVIDLKIALEKMPDNATVVIDVSSKNSDNFLLVSVVDVDIISVDSELKKEDMVMIFSDYETINHSSN